MRWEAATLEGSWSQAALVSRPIRAALSKGTDPVVLLPSCSPLTPAPFPYPNLGLILQVPDGHSTSYPSLLSHLTSTYLNAPVLALPVAKRQPPAPGLRSFHPLASSPPCDFHLLNLRMLQAEVSMPCDSRTKFWPVIFPRLLPIPVPPSEYRLCTVCHPG